MAPGRSQAANQPLYQPPPAWAKPVPIPLDIKRSGAAADILLLTVQNRFSNGVEIFSEHAIRINAPEGLQQAGSVVQVWNPLTDTLIIHSARILRGGRTIDLLAGGHKFTVLRRETNLEAAMIDGQLTATLQPEGLQVGDVVDVAMTLIRRDPALAGHAMGGGLAAHAGVIGRLKITASWPEGRSFHVWKTDDLPALEPVTRSGWTEVGFDQTDAVSPEPPRGAPIFDRLFGLMAVSDFKDWKEVSAVSYPLYDKAAALSVTSPLHAEIARIRAASPDPKTRTLLALKLVESQTRYLFVGLDAGGLTPAPADLTWTRRFGDCKGKTVLLLALLRGLGLEAKPALVHTTLGEALDREAPSMGAFDHVILRVEIAGRTYWLDATRMGDENLDVIPVPNDHWALPLRREGAGLEPVGPAPPTRPYVETVVKADARAGVDQPAKVHAEVLMRGDAALGFSLAMRQLSQADGQRVLRQAFTSDRSWIQPDKVGFSYDPQTMQARLTLEGSGRLPFASAGGSAGGVREWTVEGAAIGFDPDFTRPSPYHRDAPFAVAYPAFTRTVVQVDLPNGGKGFETANGEATDRTAAGVVYTRAAEIVDGRMIMTASNRAVVDHVSVADARASEPALRGMSDYQTFLRYTPQIATASKGENIAASPPAESNSSASAEAAFQSKDYAGAEAGFTAALKSGLTAKLYYDRAAARAAQGKDGGARSDLEAALKLEPRHALALFALGRLALAQGDTAEADRRFSEALGVRPAAVMQVASSYERARRFAEAARYYDRVVDAATSSTAKVQALNASCWSRAEGGIDLETARKACDQALFLDPSAPDVLDSRGLVELRLNSPEKAVSDYDAALHLRPLAPSSLYGRALAEARLGRTEAAKADKAAALQADAKVEANFASWGVTR